MILEEETFNEFGYLPSELSPKSNKKVLASCECCGKVRTVFKSGYRDLCLSCSAKASYEKRYTEATRKKMSEKKKGRNHPFYGKHLSEEHRRKIGDAERGEKNHNFGKHMSEESREKMSKAHTGKKLTEEHKRKVSESNKGKIVSEETRRKISKSHIGIRQTEEAKEKLREARKKQKSFPRHHTKPELIFEEICKKYNLQYKYTGDGSFWIENINPDFIECNGKKIAIEIFSYWHDPIRRFGKVRYPQTYEGRKEILKQYGWKSIVFWQEDLEREDAEAFVLSTLKREGGM